MKRLNYIFFGMCFIAASLGEVFCIHILNDDWLSIGGMAIVVLITGYLLLTSIRDHWRSESEKLNDRLTELNTILKANYTATKKSSILLLRDMEQLTIHSNSLENKYETVLNKLMELDTKLLEVQKNSLDLESRDYNEELLINTKSNVNEKQNVIPLYEDPNKALTKEEIASLFASYGQ